MIDANTIERINDAARIEEVVGDFVTLRRRGVNMIGLCPFHNEKTPSFTVSPAKGIFKCFGCGKGGNSVHFIMEHEQMSYVEALRYLAKKYHIEIEERELTKDELQANNDRESMLLVNDFAQKYFTNILHHHAEGKAIGLSYFHERGFREDIIAKFQLGYSLDERDGFTQTALKEGYKQEFLVKTGLTIEGENNYLADRFRGRVIFPVHSLSGKVLAFGGRVLKKDEKTAKYVNSPESEIYHKSNELYGIYFAKQSIVKHERCYLVEGYTDVISMHQSGIENVVASSGTSLTEGQIRLIHRFTENVTVIYDGDAAGIKASIRGIDMLLEEGLNIKVLLLPDGDDPDSFARKNNASDFIEFVEKNSTDFIRFKTNLLIDDAGNDPIKKSKLIQDLVKSISKIPSQIIRAEYVKECSTLLDMEERALYYEISKIKIKASEELNKAASRSSNVTPTEAAKSSSPGEELRTDIQEKFHQEEKNILRTLIKYGDKTLYEDKEDNTLITVGEYILTELESDGIVFATPVHQKLITEYKNNRKNINFNSAEKYFLNHSDYEINALAADLISDKYVLSKIHSMFKTVDKDEDRLYELTPRYIYEYKLAIILNKRKEKMLEMKKAVGKIDEGEVVRLMDEIGQIDFLRNKLSEELDRVLTLL